MITRLCAVDDMTPGTARRFDVGAHRIALVRIGDAFHGVGDRCSHANFSLAEGEVWPDECEIECWKHGSTFSLLTGEPQSLPATTAVPVYKIRVDDGSVWVDLADVEVADSEVPDAEVADSEVADAGAPHGAAKTDGQRKQV